MTGPGQARALRVVVIGAGFGGVAAAARLVRAGCDVTLLERADRPGGVWRDNTYPGCACDIPAPLYSLSYAPNPRWTSWFPPQPEILDYLEGCIDRFGLRHRIRLGHRVTRATWDEGAGRWRVRATTGDGQDVELDADVLVPAVGQLSSPSDGASGAGLPGVETFGGPVFHSARWPAGVDLRGRRVGVVGTGASAVQIVPALAGTAARVTVFQRSAPWTLPKPNPRRGPLGRSVYRRVPGLLRVPRAGFWLLTVVTGRAIRGKPLARAAVTGISRAQRRLQVRDPGLRARVTPDYPMGCKRVLFSNDWYPTLARPDVDLVTSPVRKVVAGGVLTQDGIRHELDVLVLGTGFEATRLLAPIEVEGRGGARLHDVWADGARAHLGMAVPGFPNLFLMYGPNTNTGNTSVLYFLEAQAGYLDQAVRLLVSRRSADPRAALEVRAEVEQDYDAALQRRLARSVWTACSNWYRAPSGRLVSNWPGSAAEYHRRTSRLDPADFH